MTSRACDGEEWEGAEGRGGGRWKVSSVSREVYHVRESMPLKTVSTIIARDLTQAA